MTAPAPRPPYIAGLHARDLFADASYQRDVDPKRVQAMAKEFDRRLLGVLEVSTRTDGRFAILDGQHRHRVVLAADPAGPAAILVCQVYEGLTPEEEARLFYEINARRKALSFWDRWKSRRISGDKRVLAIEAVLASHRLQVHPSAADGNIGATKALEVIVEDIGDLTLLNAVVVALLSAFGRTRDAFDGAVMEGMAYVLANYDPQEIELARLVQALGDMPVRQLRARAGSMRELHRGTLARLVAGVIVEQYNRTRGPKAESFFARVPERSRADRAANRARGHSAHSAQQTSGAAEDRPSSPTAPDGERAPGSAPLTAQAWPGPRETPRPAAPDPQRTAELAAAGLCVSCGHPPRVHDDGDDGEGFCLIAECDCTALKLTAELTA